MLFDECEPRVNIFRGLYAKFWLKIWLALASIFPNWEMGFFSESLQNACYITFSTFCATIETSPNGKQCTRCSPGPLPCLSLFLYISLSFTLAVQYFIALYEARGSCYWNLHLGLAWHFFLFLFLFRFLCFFTFHCLQFLIFRQPPLSSSLTQFELWPHGGRDVRERERGREAHLCIFYGLLCDLNEINIGFTSTANGFGFVQAWLVGAPVFSFFP